MDRITVDDIILEKNDISAIREQVIGWRDESMKQWPEAIDFTIVASHLIAVLAGVIEQYPEP
jgi:hypothetical protein